MNEWNKNIFHNIFKKKSELWARLEGIQRSICAGGPRRLLALEAKLKIEMEQVLAQEEMLWFQKSRQNAIKDGDRNTRYFHLSTVIRRKRNRIETLQHNNGNWCFDQDVIKQNVQEYWYSLFQDQDPGSTGNQLLHEAFPRMSDNEFEVLNRPFAACEVKYALMSMDAYKAPGPDGFQPLFYQRFWETVSPSLIQLVHDVLRGVDFPDGLNDAYLVLIPKNDVP